ncbi:MAG: molybdopterin-dependent oxidoreductase [Chloroflexi bacterium]|nr:molybdopterin-dependent oxidoreductase [Chloroflexota bacterium]
MNWHSLNRRDFLKLGVTGAAFWALESKLPEIVAADELVQGGRSVSRTTGSLRKAFASTCLQCPARCGILGFIEEDTLVKIEGNPLDPNTRGRLCAKGQAAVNLVYNPDRVLRPLRRAGARGGGKWQTISWDEAINEIAGRLSEARNRPDQFVFVGGMEGVEGATGLLARAFGTASVFDETASLWSNKATALRMTWGEEMEVPDIASTRYILNFGADPYDAHPFYLPLVRRLIDARMKGAKLVTFDPRLSDTAAKSDEWLPIRPGADGIVALAMADVIMRGGLHDKDFIAKWLNVSADQLSGHLAQYTPEAAEAASGIPAATITRLAVEFAAHRPAVVISGSGVSQHVSGVLSERAVALLNAITGNIDVPGGSCLPRRLELAEPEPAAPSFGAGLPRGTHTLFPSIRDGQLKAAALMTSLANPVFSGPETAAGVEVLRDERLVPFYVAHDTFVNETTVWADIVLPATTFLERWDVQSVPSFEMVPAVSLMQPVILPRGESRSFFDLSLHLARRIGGGLEQHFAFGSMEKYVAAAIAPIQGLVQAGGLKFLREKGVWYDVAAKPSYKSYEAGGFKTPSKKYEVLAGPQGRPQTLPVYQPIAAFQDMAEDEFHLVLFQWNVHTYARTADCMWLSEIVHENAVWLNPQTAKARGIKKGDPVRITSPLGSIVSRAWLTQGVRPNVVAMGACVAHWESSRIARGQSFKSQDPNSELVWWGKHGTGSHPHRLIPSLSDPAGGGQAWMDTVVRLEKVQSQGPNPSPPSQKAVLSALSAGGSSELSTKLIATKQPESVLSPLST